MSQVLDARAKEREQTRRNASRYGPLLLPPPLSVAARVHQPGTVVVSLCGEVNPDTSPMIGRAIARHLSGAPERIIITLNGVTVFTAAGVGQLVKAQRDGAALKFELVLVAPSDAALHALHSSGTVDRFAIHSTVDDALR